MNISSSVVDNNIKNMLTHIHISIAVLHSAFSLLTFGTFMLQLTCYRRQNRQQRWRRLRSAVHSDEARTILTLAVLTVYVFIETEGILSTVKSSVLNVGVHVSNTLSLVGTGCCLLICTVSFEGAFLIFRFVMFFYWLGCAILEVLRFILYGQESLPLSADTDVHFLLSFLLLLLYIVLTTLEAIVLFHEKYKCCHANTTEPKDDFSTVKYIHSYTTLLSKMLLGWMSKLLLDGYRRCLSMDDLGSIPQRESTSVNFMKFKLALQNEKKDSFVKNRSLSLWRCMWHMSRSMMLLSGLCKLFSDLLIYVPPICLDLIITYAARESLNQHNESDIFNATVSAGDLRNISIREFFTNGYVASMICFLALLLQFLCTQHNFFISVREGIRCKCAIQAAVYDKCLCLSVTNLNEGQIMNHITVDVGRIVMFFNFAHYIWALPFEIITGFLVLYAQLGVSALVSGLLILFMVPVQYFLALRLAATQKRIMEQSDERLLKCAELLQNIKLLKLYSWEKLFYGFVDAIRRKELRLMMKAALIRILSVTFTDGVPFMACLMAFTLYHRLESEPLLPAKVFSSVALFANFATQLFVITLVINIASQARVSVNRLQDFLQIPEIKKSHSKQLMSKSMVNGKSLSMAEDNYASVEFIEADVKSNTEEMQPLNMINEPYSDSSFMVNPVTNQDTSVNKRISQVDKSEFAVEIVDGCFVWKSESILSDINVKIPTNELTMIVGPIGSGKSSLLWAMLGEMQQTAGSVVMHSRSVAVVPQSCWILNATVRDNIVFGQPYDEDRYHTVLEASSLEQDLALFVNRDETEIGEKGANLSGGQRQRIGIARALYADADIYILDDSLSALDAHVGSEVFNNAIMKLLLETRQKTVVLVTHHTHLLTHANHLIVMKQGQVAYSGSLKQLLLNDPQLYASLTEFTADKHIPSKSSSSVHCSDGTFLSQSSINDFFDGSKFSHIVPSMSPALSVNSLSSVSARKDVFKRAESNDADEGVLGKLIEEEEMASGSVSVRIYLDYIVAAVWIGVLCTLLLFALCQAGHMTADYFLAEMVNIGMEIKIAELSNNTSMEDQHWASYYHLMNIFIALSTVCILLVPISSFCLEISCINASRNLHQKTLQNIISAPIQFFERTPIGRILNRLSADMNVIDERLSGCVETLLFCTFYVLGGIVLNSVFVPYFIAPVIPLFIIFIVIQRFFITSSRELQRLDCVTRSPIMAHLSQTLSGLTTIRAFRNEKQFQEQNWEKIDANQLPFLFYHTTNIWLGIRLDIVGAFIVLAACLASVTSCLFGHIDSGMVGLVIAHAIMISSFLNWMMRGVSETEIHFNSVERIIEYSNLESEPYETTKIDIITSGMSPSPHWPAKGDIQFKSVSLKYNMSQDPVVRNISLHVKPGQKIGICGRTGSGKSSLTMSLFRAVYISGGEILLDGINIMHVPLQTLRSKLSIIPQEPVMFSGTIRFNIDPVGTIDDEKIWNVLQIAQLNELIMGLPDKLDTVITDGGTVFSIGQKQLFCLARALLRETKVLIMDEATASVDVETDRAIQQIVQQACICRTVLIIAHRISTIQNCDAIVVLRDGELIEHGTPHDLSRITDGAFANMLAENKL